MSVYLMHHGIKGQKWGVRKYQNQDGSLTPEGRKRYGVIGAIKAKRQKKKEMKEAYKKLTNYEIEVGNKWEKTDEGKRLTKEYRKKERAMWNSNNPDKEQRLSDEFSAAERKMLIAQGRHVARQLVKTYGEDGAREILDSGSSGQWRIAGNFVENYAKRYADVHAY